MALNRMLRLIQNEIMKIFRKLPTWIMFGILFMLAVGNALSPKFTHDKSNQSIWGVVYSSDVLIFVISIFIIIIGSSVTADEFSSGTIKLLLIRPVMRWKILLSKYLAAMLTALFMLFLLFTASFLIGGIVFGFGGVFKPYNVAVRGATNGINIIAYIFIRYGLNFLQLIMYVTLAFMISAIFRSSSLATGLGLFLMLAGKTIVLVFSDYSWIKYVLFANLDLTGYLDGPHIVSGMSMKFSLIILAVYFIIFNAIAWAAFIKRDVAV